MDMTDGGMMSPEELDEQLRRGVVRIIDRAGGVVGTGFFVTEHLIATCAHVVGKALSDDGRVPSIEGGETIIILLSGCSPEEFLSATVESESFRDEDAEDIAFLRIVHPDEERLQRFLGSIRPLRLSSSLDLPGTNLRGFAFPSVFPSGLPMTAVVIAAVHTPKRGRRIHVSSKNISLGCSGGPLWDERGGVVGMAVSIIPQDGTGRHTDTAFMIAAETLASACHEVNIKAAYRSPSPDNDIFVETLTPGEIDLYLQKIIAHHERVTPIGAQRRFSFSLTDLYTPIPVFYDPQRKGADIEATAPETSSRGIGSVDLALDQVFDLVRSRGRRGVVLLGLPGSGKTTHLKYLLLEVARKGGAHLGLPPHIVPVFMALSKLSDVKIGLPRLINDQLHNPLRDMPPDFGERLCRRGRLLFLFDGLDEIGSHKDRAEVGRWIESIRKSATDSYIIVSCRYAGYSGTGVEFENDFLEVHTSPLSGRGVYDFVKCWYRMLSIESGEDIQDAPSHAGMLDLLRTLDSPQFTSIPQLLEMAQNPLMLATICMVHHERKKLPRARAELYESCISVLLERWHRRIDLEIPEGLAASIVKFIATWMHSKSGRTQASATEFGKHLKHLDIRKVVSGQTTETALLQTIRDDSGIFSYRGMGEYGFIHLGIQEFLTAQHLGQLGLVKPAVFDQLASKIIDPWWLEVILLMLALPDLNLYEPFMRALLKRPEFAEIWDSSAIQLCMAEAAHVSPAPFVEVLLASKRHWLLNLRLAKMDGARRLAAAQLLARFMPEVLAGLADQLSEHPIAAVRSWWQSRPHTTMPPGRVAFSPKGGVELALVGGDKPFYIARTPITNAQYAEYLESNVFRAESPRFWGHRDFNQPRQPVVGITVRDATRYCEWAGLELPDSWFWDRAYAHPNAKPPPGWCGSDEDERKHYELQRLLLSTHTDYPGPRLQLTPEQRSQRLESGWFEENSNGRLHNVAEKQPNSLGLYDMDGNIWEWCTSTWTHVSSGDDRSVEEYLKYGETHLLRGGSWQSSIKSYETTARAKASANTIGFRPILLI